MANWFASSSPSWRPSPRCERPSLSRWPPDRLRNPSASAAPFAGSAPACARSHRERARARRRMPEGKISCNSSIRRQRRRAARCVIDGAFAGATDLARWQTVAGRKTRWPGKAGWGGLEAAAARRSALRRVQGHARQRSAASRQSSRVLVFSRPHPTAIQRRPRRTSNCTRLPLAGLAKRRRLRKAWPRHLSATWAYGGRSGGRSGGRAGGSQWRPVAYLPAPIVCQRQQP